MLSYCSAATVTDHVKQLRTALLPENSRSREGNPVTLADITHRHIPTHNGELTERRKLQLADDLADAYFQSGHGDFELTKDILAAFFRKPEIQPMLLECLDRADIKLNIHTKEDAKMVLSRSFYGALVAGQNVAVTVKAIKVQRTATAVNHTCNRSCNHSCNCGCKYVVLML